MHDAKRWAAAVVVVMAIGLWVGTETGRSQGVGQRLPGAAAGAAVDAADYASLQAAIDALPETGGVVNLPPGEFAISRPLVIRRGDVTLRGAGGATHIRNVNEAGRPAILISPTPESTQLPPRTQSVWRVMIADLRITGNEKSGAGVEAVRVNEIFIQGATISDHGGDGILLNNCYEDPRINDCLITYNEQAGLRLIGCHDIVVSGNQFEENLDAVVCLDGFNLCMSGNNLDDHLRHGVVIENTYGSVVAGNMIEECQGMGIILDRDCYGITLSANVIAHEFGGGIDLRDAHGCAVTGNSFPICKNFGVRVGPGSGRIAITGNTFADSYLGGGTKRSGGSQREPDANAAGGIVLEGATDLAISGNVFSSVRPKALTLSGGPTKRVAFTGNTIADAESDHAKLTDSVIADNVQ